MTLTLTKPEVLLPELDRPDAGQIGDEILIESAASTKVGRVQSGDSRRSESRAWTKRGNVD
jgi:hypothetical protein